MTQIVTVVKSKAHDSDDFVSLTHNIFNCDNTSFVQKKTPFTSNNPFFETRPPYNQCRSTNPTKTFILNALKYKI